MINFKKIVRKKHLMLLIISILAVTNKDSNCLIRNIDDTSNLSRRNHSNTLRLSKHLTEVQQTKLTRNDSIQIKSILNDNHAKQNKLSHAYITFIHNHFEISYNGKVRFDITKIANTLEPSNNFDELRSIYLDAISTNIEFIKYLFKELLFIQLNFKPENRLGNTYIEYLPFSNFLRYDIFYIQPELIDIQTQYNKNNHYIIFYNEDLTHKEIYNIVSCSIKELIKQSKKPNFKYNSEYVQINYDFIIECFIRDIENQNLESIERFAQFVEENVAENKALEISDQCLKSLNPEKYKQIIRKLSNINDRDVSLRSLNITPEQLIFIILCLKQFQNLTKLNLSHNQLTTLPKSIKQLTNLTKLDLSHNQLTTSPTKSIKQLTNLTYLNLRFNQLREEPETIGKLRKSLFFNVYEKRSFLDFFISFG